jgi:23S rRNA pseudouridine1911/1915/1917 synthase
MPEPHQEQEIFPENIPLDIRLEDQELLIVHKPAGMVVHPAYKNWSGTLVNGLLWHFRNLPEMPGNKGRPGLVHRIDKDTSGLLVIAKSEKAMKSLAKQFYEHSIERTYYALVWGEPEPAKGTIDVHLGRSFKDRRLTIAFPKRDFGRRAVTHYKTLQTFRYVSLIQCNLETGRTHQIRAHMKYIGHPIFNDATYGGDQILKGTLFSKYKQFVQNCFKIMPRHALHAKTLGFIHPRTEKIIKLNSDVPADFKQVLAKWKRYINYIED